MDVKHTAPRRKKTAENLPTADTCKEDKTEQLKQNFEQQYGHELEEFRQNQKKFEREKKEFLRKKEKEKKEFQRQKEMEMRRISQEDQLFRMKWKLLEEEVQKLACEKQRMERQRSFYERVSDFERKGYEGIKTPSLRAVRGEMFFAGVTSELALKKRYRDLIKIYHPDNVSGDTGTIQEINREYDNLKNRLESC